MNVRDKLFLAPLAGITDSSFRNICIEQGADIVCTELISAMGLIHNSAKSFRLMDFTPSSYTAGIQIFGSSPAHLAAAARIAERQSPDFIDINMGCSVKKVVRTGSGAAMLRNPGLIEQCVSAVKRSVNVPVSAKIRLGWDRNNALEIARAVRNGGASFISVHGRTAVQGFSGSADWDAIADIKNELTIPVIGNGDIDSPRKALEMKSYGVDSIMIGRAAMGNPFIFRNIKSLEEEGAYSPATAGERIACLRKHYTMAGRQNDVSFIKYMRKHFHWYTKGIRNIKKYREIINYTESYSEVEQILDKLESNEITIQL
ncbi:MAG: tRNA dihydrouridine synthase DusB [bacterium]